MRPLIVKGLVSVGGLAECCMLAAAHPAVGTQRLHHQSTDLALQALCDALKQLLPGLLACARSQQSGQR